MSTLRQQAKSVFDRAIEISSESERNQFLESSYRQAPAIQDLVEGLLHAHFQAGSFLDKVPADTVDAADFEGPVPGSMIGPYKLLQQLGEGGMGVVYLAERQHPVKQRVALKLLKPGMDSKRFVARTSVGLFVHGLTRYMLAIDQSNDLEFETAFEFLRSAKYLMRGSRNATYVELLALSVAIQRAHERGDIDRVRTLASQGRPLADKLLAPNYFGCYPWQFYRVVENIERVGQAGDIHEDELIKLAGKHRYTLAIAYCSIAFKALSDDDREKARDHFRKAVETESFGSSDFGMANAYLHRMSEDENWPHWLDQESDSGRREPATPSTAVGQ